VATLTFLKDDGLFIYEDYLKGRAALRIKELSTAIPSQVIKRTSGGDPQAVLVSKAWYDARVAAFNAGDTPLFSNLKELVDDDFMGSNLSLMIDLIRGKKQTVLQSASTTNRGITQDDFGVWSIVEFKEFFRDDSTAVPFEDTSRLGGDVQALLLHNAHHAALAATPVATIYAGTGDGTIVSTLHHGGAVTETITVTATSATSFDVVGTVSGAIGTLTVGTTFVSEQITIDITAGGTPFVATDVFTIDSVAAVF
jgi:hypothetical protein